MSSIVPHFSKYVNTVLFYKCINAYFFINPCFCTHYVWWMNNGSKYKKNRPEHRYVLGKGKDLTQH